MALCASGFHSCHNAVEAKPAHVNITKKKTVHVYFFEGFNASLGKSAIKDLNNFFNSVSFEGVIPYPDSAFYPPRDRYKADKLVKHLRKLQESTSDPVIAFAGKDISVGLHGYDDFGVMGWTRISIKSSVVSSHRLKQGSAMKRDFLKLAIHELAHADGVPHCKNSDQCIMRDANKKNLFPELNGFCPKCSSLLSKRGWKGRYINSVKIKMVCW